MSEYSTDQYSEFPESRKICDAIYNDVLKSVSAEEYFESLHDDYKTTQGWTVFEQVQEGIRRGIPYLQAESPSQGFMSCIRAGGLLGVHMATKELGQNGEAVVAKAMAWVYGQAVAQAGDDPESFDQSTDNLTGCLIDIGDCGSDMLDKEHDHLIEDICERRELDDEGSVHYTRIGFGFVKFAVTEYADFVQRSSELAKSDAMEIQLQNDETSAYIDEQLRRLIEDEQNK